jgi:hypothetical protein
MTAMSIATFVVFLFLAAFGKRPWNWVLVFAGGVLLFALVWAIDFARMLSTIRVGGEYSSPVDLFLPVMWLGGFFTGSLVALFRHGHAQYKLKRTDWRWGVVLTIGWLLLGVWALGGVLKGNSNDLVRALANFLLALMSASIVVVKSALTARGIRASVFDVIEWNEIESYEWRGTKLILHLRARLLPRWLAQSSLKVVPEEQAIVNRFLAQHLPEQQIQSPTPTQVSA